MSVCNSNLNIQPGQKVWLSLEILNWPATTSEMLFGQTNWQEHYDLWEHANKVLSGTPSEQHCVDVIVQLRRALYFREKALKSVYPLDKIPGYGNKANRITLSDLNVTLPIMQRKLIDLRNKVIHESIKLSSNIDQCLEYSEFVWYFLKSTDHLLSSPIKALNFDDPNNRGSYNLDFTLKDWTINLVGKFDIGLASGPQNHNNIEVEIFKAEILQQMIYFKAHPHTSEGSICRTSPSSMLRILKIYFASRH